jgi:hypothetical protein
MSCLYVFFHSLEDESGQFRFELSCFIFWNHMSKGMTMTQTQSNLSESVLPKLLERECEIGVSDLWQRIRWLYLVSETFVNELGFGFEMEKGSLPGDPTVQMTQKIRSCRAVLERILRLPACVRMISHHEPNIMKRDCSFVSWCPGKPDSVFSGTEYTDCLQTLFQFLLSQRPASVQEDERLEFSAQSFSESSLQRVLTGASLLASFGAEMKRLGDSLTCSELRFADPPSSGFSLMGIRIGRRRESNHRYFSDEAASELPCFYSSTSAFADWHLEALRETDLVECALQDPGAFQTLNDFSDFDPNLVFSTWWAAFSEVGIALDGVFIQVMGSPVESFGLQATESET